jgi:prepilin-type N-terminal cleavage/methylation domain-containing protein
MREREVAMRKQDKGFTLIELFIALFLLSIALLALTQLGVSTIHTNQSASEDAIATRLAQNKIDELKKTAYVSLGLNNYTDPNNPINSQGNVGGQYTRSWSVIAGPVAGTKKISVLVAWAGSKSLTLNTLVSDEGS